MLSVYKVLKQINKNNSTQDNNEITLSQSEWYISKLLGKLWCWLERGEKETLIHYRRKYMIQFLWKISHKLTIELIYDPEIPLLTIYPQARLKRHSLN